MACINKGLEEVVAKGRRRDHWIEGVGVRRTSKPSYRSPTLATCASRDAPRVAPLPETIAPRATAEGGHPLPEFGSLPSAKCFAECFFQH